MKRDRAASQTAIQLPECMPPRAEPVFLLRGQDVCAPATVRFWAREAKKQGVDEGTIQAALQLAIEMEAWPTRNTAGYALKGSIANPNHSALCGSKPSGRMRKK
jgi:hypothetical protein